MGQNLIPPNPNDITIESETLLDPRENHKTDRLNDLPEDTVIGSGKRMTKSAYEAKGSIEGAGTNFEKKIDYSKIRKAELKEIIKKHKKELNNVNITGLTKKKMITLVEQIMSL